MMYVVNCSSASGSFVKRRAFKRIAGGAVDRDERGHPYWQEAAHAVPPGG